MILLVGVLLVLLACGVPVAFAIAVASSLFLLLGGQSIPFAQLPQMSVSGANNILLLAVPFFMFAGELMNRGGITRRLVAFAEALVGGIRGGLSYVVVLVNMIMAGVSGAAIADAAAVGSAMIPSMVKSGYRRGFAGAVNAAAATVGPVIPPSVGFIIYASVANDPRVTVGKLFLAGAVPGVIMGLYMMGACFIIAHRQGLPRGERTSLRKALHGLKDAVWALLMPVIILGGILGGVVTPTEAGVVAVLYGLFVGCVVYREIRLRDTPFLLAKAAKQSAIVMIVIAFANTFGWLLKYINAPQALIGAFGSVSGQAWVFLLIINAVVIGLGCFMEGGSIMIILTPLLMPVLARYAIDPVHFGVVFQLNIMIGLLTPPVGMLLYVITGVSGVPMNEILRDLWPFLIAILLVLLLITFVPAITLWLPGLLS
jgi:C4-dicarboxylate transporter DctM subunit